MAQALRAGQVTRADELRELLANVEKRLANARGSGEGVALLLTELDRIAALWPQLEAQGLDLRPEAGRWETIQQNVLRKADAIVAELKTQGGIEQLRRERHPGGADAAWWNLDTYLRDRRRATALRGVLALVGVVVAAVALNFILRALFPVDPKVQESVRRVSSGEQLVQQGGDFAGALAEFEAAATATPDDPDVWLRIGVTREQLGDGPGAQAAFDRARQLSASELDFFRARGQAYLILGQVDAADADLRAAIDIKHDDARSWFLMANVFETREQLPEAIDALDKASQYAEETNESELVAAARYRMGVLTQRLNFAPPADTGVPTP